MPSIQSILKDAAPHVPPPGPYVLDQDLARGRAAVRRSHRRRSLAGAGITAAIVAACVALIPGVVHSSRSTPGAASARIAPAHRALSPHRSTAGMGAHTAIRLASYTGAQLPGFTVRAVPAGWHLSTSISDALLITPDGSTNNDPNDFLDKLAVLTSSVDQQGLGDGTTVSVNGQPGKVSSQDGMLLLNYDTANGFGVNIQAPAALGWNDQEIVAFADGVSVTSNAVHSRG